MGRFQTGKVLDTCFTILAQSAVQVSVLVILGTQASWAVGNLASTNPVPSMDYSKPVLATIVGYENDETHERFLPDIANVPLFGNFDFSHPKNTYDRNTPEWWDNLIEEALFSRVHVIMPLARGCLKSDAEIQAEGGSPHPQQESGFGNSCPRTLKRLTEALKRNQVQPGALRFAYFDDTAAYQPANEGKFLDITDQAQVLKLMWDRNIMVFFDTVPRPYWYLDENGRPLLVIWAPSFFANVDAAHTAQVNSAFNSIRELFKQRYGVYPSIYLHHDWVERVPDIKLGFVQGAYGWTDPIHGKLSGFFKWRGIKMGTVSPGFRREAYVDHGQNIYFKRGCGSQPMTNWEIHCWEVSRDHGSALKRGMSDAYGQIGAPQSDGKAAKFVILEGFANVPESAGFYRSTGLDYDYPNQYLNYIREYADPNPKEITFQAEASDYRQGDGKAGNSGGAFSNDALDVGRLPVTGYYVGWVQKGEVIGFQKVKLPSKPFEIRIRTASPFDQRMVKITFERVAETPRGSSPGVSPIDALYGPWTVTVPKTADWINFQETSVAVFKPMPGAYNIKVEMLTDGLNIDWIQLREAPSN
jgi:hypothetical protein